MQKTLVEVVNDDREDVTKEHDLKMCSLGDDEAEEMCSLEDDDTRGDRHIATKGEVVKILEFTHFSRVFKFNKTSEIGRKKEIFHEIKVSVVMELV